MQLQCIINNKTVKETVNPGVVVLDFLRNHERLTGTKEGCREGDCGACTILIGELRGSQVVYASVNSCLMPLGDAYGKHLVTIEGLNRPSGELTPVQQAFVDEGGTQCGFCTPGFILSLTGYCVNAEEYEEQSALLSIDGNVCRCTGHPPIKKAVHRIVEQLKNKSRSVGRSMDFLIEQQLLPEYFRGIPSRLKEIAPRALSTVQNNGTSIVSGGTDVYVQRAFTMCAEESQQISGWQKGADIYEKDRMIIIPATTTVDDIRTSPIIEKYLPQLQEQLKLFGSSPIRHRATIAGNIVNASPIGDMICILLALNASLTLREGTSVRVVPLRKFYLGYKQLEKTKSELVETITIPTPSSLAKWNYEKISRRQHLDIASVNSAMIFDLHENVMTNVAISAGGVGPVPMVLIKSSELMEGKTPSPKVADELFKTAQTEIQPISDARGSAEYKRLLLRQLLAAHLLAQFPGLIRKEMLV